MSERIGLGLVLWALLALGCTQEADLKPRLDAVSPSSLTAGRDGYVILEGRFSVGLAWEEDGPSTDESHRVLFGGKLSPEVHLLSPAHLSARLPEGGLAAGQLDVEVLGLNGSSTSLPGALCVTEQSEVKLLAGCVMGGRSNVCVTDLSLDSGGLEVLLPGALATISVEDALYHQVLGMAPGYDVSRDGLHAAYLSVTNVGVNEYSLDLKFGVVGNLESHEVVVSRDFVLNGPFLLSFPKISQDGKRLIYIRDAQQIVSHDIDPLSGKLGPARLVFDAMEDEPESVLVWLEVDPTSRRVVVTRVLPLEEECQVKFFGFYRSELLVLDLDDGRLVFRSRPDEACRSDGPGIFHPAGDRLVFISNREGRRVDSPFGAFMFSNSVYSRGLSAEDPLVDLLRYDTALFIGPPRISPNARKLAFCGTMLDFSGLGLDVMILDLDGGKLMRVYNEYVPHCIPPLSEICTPGEIFGGECCLTADFCCNPTTGERCPIWDFTPAFDPLGNYVIYSGVPYSWRCGNNTSWDIMSISGIKLFYSAWDAEKGRFYGVDATPEPLQMQLMLSSPRIIEIPTCAQ